MKHVIARERSPERSEGRSESGAKRSLPEGDRSNLLDRRLLRPSHSFGARNDTRNLLQRAIDANLNRAREALRVCEDITRFILDAKALTKSLKNIRHKVSKIADRLFVKNLLSIKHRDTAGDVGRVSLFDRGRPSDFKTLFYKNCHRAQESIRALEEFSKLIQGNFSGQFKALRFKVYSVEKKAIKKLQALCSD